MRVTQAITACATALTLCLAAYGATIPATAVADAAMKGDQATVKTLLSQKADVNAPQADGATAIQWAAYNNNLALADILIKGGANVRLANHDGATPMSLAATNGNAAMIEKLLRAGADPNERQPTGETPLMLVSRSGNVDAIKVLIDHKADVNAKEQLRGTTAIMWAAEQSHPDAVKLLAQNGADVKAMSDPDTRNSRLNLAPTVQQRLNSAQGAGGLSANGNGTLTPGQPGAAPGRGRGGRGGPGRGAGRGAARGGAAAGTEKGPAFNEETAVAEDFAFFRRAAPKDGGGLTPLAFAAREGCFDCAVNLVAAGADINEQTLYGWSPLLVATQNRHYKLAAWMLDHGADPNLANKGGWRPLYLATDNRNIESGDYPVRKPDMDHLDFIKLLVEKGADVNARICGAQSTPKECKGDTTETRTNFTMQWLYEDGATPFLRAAQSGDVALMKYLLAHGADPKIATAHKDTALAVASGIGWVEGVTYEWSEAENLEAVKMCLDAGIDVNTADVEGRTALHGAAHKGRTAVIQMLVDHGANLEAHDLGSRDTVNGAMKGLTWIPLDWSRGLVRVGVQSAIAHPEAEKLLVKLMKEKGLPIPPPPSSSICLTKGVKGCQ
ncbi:MAG TPA: ankyrin repeat domain-containing protein [Bryobacteraceae bacterium]|jgi:ankyrin repeat protein|nr:ankyrin repeat domain-containing protein [Bryobacteraceae bacterium]